jgi:hypothetical protein
MAKLPSFRRIVEDQIASKYPELREALLSPLNNFMESITRALSKRLTFEDNFDGQVSTYLANGTYPVKIKWTRFSKPIGVWIVQVQRTDGLSAALTDAVYPDWSFNQEGQIEIASTAGLSDSASDEYLITLIGVTG